MRRDRMTVLAALTTTLALSSTAASAAELTVPACAVSAGHRTLPVVAGGFAPGADVQIRSGTEVLGGGQAGPDGVYRGRIAPPPFRDANDRIESFSLTAADPGDEVFSPPVTLQVVKRAVVLPPRALPRDRIRFSVFGFPVGRTVYLHVRRGGRTLRTVAIGRAAAPCGTVSRRMRALPLRRYRAGTYAYWFGTSRHATRRTALVRLSIAIFRAYG